MTIQQKAEKFSDMFISAKRDNGESYVYCNDNATEDLKNSIREAHGDRFPDDWIYGTYADLLQKVAEYELSTIDDLEESRHEIVDSYVDIYTSGLTEWLNSDNRNVDYLTQVLEEMEPKDGFQLLAMAQYTAIDEIMSEVMALLSK